MNLLLIFVAALTSIAALVGGLVTIRYRKSLPYFFAFASGTLIAVAFLDLLPETLHLSEEIPFPVYHIMLIIVASFFLYSLVDRFFISHCVGDDCKNHGHIMGPLGASSIILHSFLDGAVIGAAFLVDISVGLTVAIAVLFHEFTDGINTVTVMLKNKQNLKKTYGFLFLNAIAPILGVIVISFIGLPEIALVIILSVFIGMFIYLGAASLLPESREYPSKKTIIAMALGIFIIFIVTLFLGHSH
jgi:ZIP family zinc transporter